MASFISHLSLFLLVLVGACLTLPIVDEQLATSTSSLFNLDFTTEKIVNLRLVSEDESTVLPVSNVPQPSKDLLSGDQTSSMPSTEMFQSTAKPIDVEMSTSTDRLVPEDASRVPRTFDEVSTINMFTHPPTTERTSYEKRDEDQVSMTTVEPTTQVVEHVSRSTKDDSEHETETESTPEKREFDDLSFTTSEPFLHSSTSESEDSNDHHTREVTDNTIPVESTTEYMTSFTSTSSAVAPEFYTTESSILPSTTPRTSTLEMTSTKKYTGLLADEPVREEEHEDEHEKPVRPSKHTKYVRSSTTTTTTYRTKVDNEDDLKDSHIPTAVFDQEALEKVSNVPNDFMILDEKSDVITIAPLKLPSSTLENQIEQEKLDQGEDTAHFEEKKSNH